MFRRRWGVVMDEEYVQEHILTDGVGAPVGGASPTHSSPLTANSLALSRHTRHVSSGLTILVLVLGVVVARNATGSMLTSECNRRNGRHPGGFFCRRSTAPSAATFRNAHQWRRAVPSKTQMTNELVLTYKRVSSQVSVSILKAARFTSSGIASERC
jgi:hypothetical protein